MNVSLKNGGARLAIATLGTLLATFSIAAAANAQTATTTTSTTVTTTGVALPVMVVSPIYVANVIGVDNGTANGGVPNFAAFSDLNFGSSGPEVFDLQSFLAEGGWLHVAPTGYFGPLTQAALVQYQASAGLPNTGYFGGLTKGVLASFEANAAARLTNNSTVNITVPSMTSVSTNGGSVSTSNSQPAPLGPTGYWYNGNWYASTPGTTTSVTGYWSNGVWYGTVNTTPGTTTTTTTTTSNSTMTPSGMSSSNVHN